MNGEVIEFAWTDEADLGGLVTDRQLAAGDAGGVADVEDAHACGLWHRTFSALVINPDTRTVTPQKKAPGRAGFDRPDYADFTVGAQPLKAMASGPDILPRSGHH
jgi:hypothetical protein